MIIKLLNSIILASYPIRTGGSFLGGVKWPEHDADHSTPSSAEVKKKVELYIRSPIRLHDLFLN
jgi:hypothetical protein